MDYYWGEYCQGLNDLCVGTISDENEVWELYARMLRWEDFKITREKENFIPSKNIPPDFLFFYYFLIKPKPKREHEDTIIDVLMDGLGDYSENKQNEILDILGKETEGFDGFSYRHDLFKIIREPYSQKQETGLLGLFSYKRICSEKIEAISGLENISFFGVHLYFLEDFVVTRNYKRISYQMIRFK